MSDQYNEVFFIYYKNKDGKPVYLNNPSFEEGQIIQWGLTPSPAEAHGWPTFVEAAERAKEMNFVFECDDVPDAQTPWDVRTGKLLLDRID